LLPCIIHHNTHHNYSVNNVSYPDVTVVTDLGVLVDNNLRFTKHYRSMVNRPEANHRSSLILKSFQSRNPQFLFRAFTVCVRPMLDYCSPVWAPVYKTDINFIERVQRRSTKRLLGLKDISYHDRLVILDNADTLEIRRLKMDLIMLFKITHNLVALDTCSFFGLTNYTGRPTRGHNYKLVKPICHNNARQFSFACRRIDAWNDLPVNVVINALSLSSFKNLLKSCCLDRFVTLG